MTAVPLIAGPFAIIAALVVIAGFAKMARPASTVAALEAVGLLSWRPVVRALGVVEITVGLVALILGGAVSALAVGALYTVFSVYVALVLIRKIPVEGCGCFGREDAPPGRLHLLVVVVAAAVAGIAAAQNAPGLGAMVADQPGGGLLLVGFVAVGTWAAVLLLSELPRLWSVVREGEA